MRNWALSAAALTILCCALADAAPRKNAVAQRSTVKTIVMYEGLVDETSGGRFIDILYESIDKVVGLKITVEPSTKDESPLFVNKNEQLVVSWGPGETPEQEVVINGPVGSTWDMHTVDGFYLIKSGGQHAGGALSVGAIPVDEAAIRLNPRVRVVKKGM